MDKFIDATAIITGAASGMGEATARHLAKAGFKIALVDINEQQLSKVANEINGSAYPCDVTNEGQVDSIIDQINNQLGNIRVLVNCAGIAPAKKVIGREGPMPLNDFAKVININLIGSFNMLRATANVMTNLATITDAGERGVIINTASIAAYEGQIGQVAYSASKAGIVGMTLPLAREFARYGIRVMTIAPGIMATPMLMAMPEEVQTSLAQMMLFPKRLGLATEFASLVKHIIKNEYLNGEVIRLDAGIRMQEK